MTYVITHGYAHRLTRRGIVESAPVMVEGDQIAVDEKGWLQRLPETMDLTGGDAAMIESMLIQLTLNFPRDGGKRLPYSEKQKVAEMHPEDVM